MHKNLNICKYTAVKLCDEYGINQRFNLLFQEVCALKNTTPAATGGHISITSADFEADGITYINPLLKMDNTSVFWNDIPRYIYRNQGEWQYVFGGGIRILIPGFDANINSYNLELSLK